MPGSALTMTGSCKNRQSPSYSLHRDDRARGRLAPARSPSSETTSGETQFMSNFDRNAPVWGAGRAQQTSAVEMDQGLRSFMLGVYNNMAIGLGITGLAALGISM